MKQRNAFFGFGALILLASATAGADPELHQNNRSLSVVPHAQPAHHRRALAARSGRLAPHIPVAAPQGRHLRVASTAYCLQGRTASGTYVGYGTVAVDPRVIPLGTRMYIQGYGYATARDTGGAIVGNKIDVWFPSLSQCYQWGYRYVDVTILDGRR